MTEAQKLDRSLLVPSTKLPTYDVPMDTIHLYEKNPRKNDKAVPIVRKSLEDFDQKVPIVVDAYGTIVAGHTRYKAMREMGWTTCTIVLADDLTPDQVKAYRIIDNRSSEYSTWDDVLLDLELEDIEMDMTPYGFEKDVSVDVEEDGYEPEPPEDPMSKVGDVYILGDHVLVVGDATSKADLRKLLETAAGGGGLMVDCIMTDPPYNVAIEGETKDRLTILNDHMEDSSFLTFLEDAFGCMDSALKPGGAFYIWYASRNGQIFEEACERTGWEIRQCLIWAKQHFVLGRQDYQWKHEPCLYGWKAGGAHYFTDNRSLTTILEEEPYDLDHMKKEDMRKLLQRILESDVPVDVIHENKPAANKDHPTMKPIRLIATLVQNSTRRGETVLDLFGGSGSTLIACEQLGRRCLTMELDPRYADVIIDRWETFTGQKAQKVGA